jgi:hypothetical protein
MSFGIKTDNMYKIKTQLRHFRFNTVHNHGPLPVEWFKLLNSDEESEGHCLDKKELDLLTSYFENNRTNFSDPVALPCQPNENPYCGINKLLPSVEHLPTNLVLKRIPSMNKDGNIYQCMEVELLEPNGRLVSNEDLPFEVIGKILY